MSSAQRFLLGLALGTAAAVITWIVTGTAELALALGLTVLFLVWLGKFILDELL
ncbi:hypothetical protein OG413_44730 [Streptomyces sp. NBC_01433]|uniref:hypothetical protein n=1 Tax=Streptomyces sp. NBC_01433 TaxID=2903864 RepID=UPI0022588D71|nr:hypothetical protein [Streptomyces sp. NBC_01433]MCX4682291.1 hypothetical protein [Streptomyces sp. NBC_01433]